MQGTAGGEQGETGDAITERPIIRVRRKQPSAAIVDDSPVSAMPRACGWNREDRIQGPAIAPIRPAAGLSVLRTEF